MPLGLIYDHTRNTKAVQNGYVDDYRQRTVVKGLSTIRPHVWTFAEIDITWTKACLK